MQTARHILIVEDSPTQTKLLRVILEEHGFNVDAAHNGIEALEKVRNKLPHLVITDIIMPEMDGFALCQALKHDQQFKSIPVMLLTSLSDPQDVIKGLQAGADNFLTKPYEDEVLLSRIEAIFLNQELRKGKSPAGEIEIVFKGQKYYVNSDRLQVIDLLLSTYDNAIQKNTELHKAHADLMDIHYQLEQKNIQLEKLNQEKNRFLSIAAHDLRNPLTTIYTAADLITEEIKEKVGAEVKEFLEMIKQSSKFMRGLLEELLDVSVIESGNLVLHLEPVKMDELIRNNVALNRVIAERKHIIVEFEHSQESPVLQLDRKKIEQVLNNLLSNAIKYSFPHSKVIIQCRTVNTELIISVTDGGQGIPPGELDRLFKPFSRTSVKATSGETSTGLGLVIVRKIVESHKGRVWVESQVGKGSTFSFSLPL